MTPSAKVVKLNSEKKKKLEILEQFIVWEVSN